MKKKVVIEFSERWLKAVVSISTGIKHSQVSQIILEPLGEDVLGISGPLDRIFKQIGQRRGLEVIVVLSRNKITVRKLDLPSREPSEIESMLGLHVIRQVPYPKEEIIWGYQNLGFDGVSNSHIFLAIVHREVLKNIFNAFMSLDILPEAMTISSQGIIHYVFEAVKNKSFLQGTFLILDIDYNFSELLLINNQVLRSSVIISQGSKQLSQEERTKFVEELKQALVVLNNELPNTRLGRIFLTGSTTAAASLIKDMLEKDFKLDLQVIEFQEVKKIDVRGADNLSLAAALGFSYQRKKEDINFTLAEAQIKKDMKQKVRQLFAFGISLTYIFILLGALALLRIGQLQSYRDKLNFRLAKLKQDAGSVYDIAQKVKISRQYKNVNQSVISYLYEVTRIAPDNVTLTNFNWEWQKKFSIRGYASQISDISNFLQALNNSRFFKGMQTNYMRRRKVKDKDRVDFEITQK